SAPFADGLHSADTSFLESSIAHRQHLVDEQYFRLQVCRDREGKAHVHAAGVAFHRRIQELLYLGKGHNILELSIDLPPAHAEDTTVEVNVFAARQYRSN